VGTILYELLTGVVPFDGNSFGELAVKLITQRPARIPDQTPSGEPIPGSLRALANRCLEKDPARRPQSANEVAEALAPFAATGFTADIPLNLKPKRRAAAVAGAVLALCGAAFVGWLVARPQQAAEAKLDLPSGPVVAAPKPAPPELPREVKLIVDSEPKHAAVRRLDTGQDLGPAPVEIVVPREQRIALEATLAGYAPAREEILPRADTPVKLLLSKAVATASKPAPPNGAAHKKPPKKVRAPDPDDIIDPFSTR
jgi:serine/threonine-protein kinase